MPARLYTVALRRAEARLWSGRAAHLVGGTLDLVQALVLYALARRRTRGRRRARGAAASRHPSKL
ncbi:MAG: hypothetical protein E6G62_09680 [Actinobacteria bacterium]|nr:MAG: hypothetical protein E6G62_09680 [Actinomycetota bacterium]